MKKIITWITRALILSLSNYHAQAQTITIDTIRPFPLGLSENITTNIKFASPISKVDFGSPDVGGRKTGQSENILLLKAARPNFPQTNISVYLTNGAFYSFLVHYTPIPTNFNYSFKDFPAANPIHQITLPTTHITASNEEIQLTLTNLYIKDDLLWLHLRATNKSSISFKPGILHSTIRSLHPFRRTADESIDILPIHSPQNIDLPADSTITLTLAFKPLAPDRQKRLVLEWGEHDGRRILLSIKAKHLLHARRLD
ncbi:MAG: DUF4138 domain-containing protein [Bacteroidetes bacterium]|nr:DUF4138 domain-containing protein [Bacteroidota bacterium]